MEKLFMPDLWQYTLRKGKLKLKIPFLENDTIFLIIYSNEYSLTLN